MTENRNDGDSGHPREKHTEDEVVAIIQGLHEEGLPVVTTRDVTEASEYSQGYLSDKLDRLAEEERLNLINASVVKLYWVPEGAEPEGEIETEGFTRYDSIEPGRVPEQKAEEIAKERIPEYGKSPTWWQKEHEESVVGLRMGMAAFVLSIGVIFVSEAGLYSIPSFGTQIVALVFIIGIGVSFVSAVWMLITILGQKAAERGWVPEEPQEKVPEAPWVKIWRKMKDRL